MDRATESMDQRILQMQLLLLWEGRLNNARLRDLFGLSPVRASEWIREFREKHPRWTRWNTRTRSFHATPTTYGGKPLDPNAEANSLSRYLALVGLPCEELGLHSNQIVWAAFPDLSSPSPKVFSTLSEAIRQRTAVEISYRSMRDPAAHSRRILPHSLVRAGRRWHVRAYSETDSAFRDYALGRIVSVVAIDEMFTIAAGEDTAWVTKVPVRLIAHPHLTQDQQDVIKFEYFRDTSARVVTCRAALIGYFLQDLRAAIDVHMQLPPEYQLAVGNPDQLKPWVFPR